MKLIVKAALLISTLLLANVASAIQAGCPTAPDVAIHLSYQITPNQGTDPASYPITDIMTFNTYCNGGGVWWPGQVAAGGDTLIDPFAKSYLNPPNAALLLGLVTDVDANQHVVMMVNDTSAASYEDLPWPFTLEESTIINDLLFTMRNDRSTLDDSGQEDWDTKFNELFSFAIGEAIGAWFELPAAVVGTTQISSFSVVEWSDGSVVGTGKASVQTDSPASVPEPATLALVALCLPGLAATRRRKQ